MIRLNRPNFGRIDEQTDRLLSRRIETLPWRLLRSHQKTDGGEEWNSLANENGEIHPSQVFQVSYAILTGDDAVIFNSNGMDSALHD